MAAASGNKIVTVAMLEKFKELNDAAVDEKIAAGGFTLAEVADIEAMFATSGGSGGSGGAGGGTA